MTRSPAVTAINQLKPCPFCGGMARVDDRKGRAAPRYWTGCTRCGLGWGTGNTPEEAIAKWNTRAEAQPSPEAEKVARELLGCFCDPTLNDDSGRFYDILRTYAAAVRAQALEEAAQAMSPMLRDMISRGKAVELIRALPPAQGGE